MKRGNDFSIFHIETFAFLSWWWPSGTCIAILDVYVYMFTEDFDLAFIICICMLIIVLFLLYGVVRVSGTFYVLWWPVLLSISDCPGLCQIFMTSVNCLFRIALGTFCPSSACKCLTSPSAAWALSDTSAIPQTSNSGCVPRGWWVDQPNRTTWKF